MKRLSSPHSLTLPLTLSLLALGCDPLPDADGDTDGNDTDVADTDATGSTTPTDPTDGSTGELGDCPTLDQADFTGDVTFPAGCYQVPSVVAIDGRLEMEAGVEMHFGTLSTVLVANGGVIIASGSVDAPVLLTATDQSWGGIDLSGSASSENRLEGVEVDAVDGNAIELGGASRLSVIDSTVRDNEGIGLVVGAGSEIIVQGSTFSGNEVPMHVALEHVAGLGDNNTLTGNTDDLVLVDGGTLADDASWSPVGVPLRLQSDAYFDGALDLLPGIVLEFPLDGAMWVSTSGSIHAEGTAEAPVTLRGAQAERGYWKGLAVESKATANALQYCVIENAGASQWNGADETVTGIWLPDQSKLVVSDSILRGSGGSALGSQGGADISGFAGNTIEDNASTLMVSPNMAADIEPSNVFTSNDDAFVRVEYSGADTLEDAGTWSALDVPYRVLERMSVTAAWELAPGAVVEVAQDVNISIQSGGSISAIGTAEAPVRFVGAESLRGYWQGIEIHTVTDDNVLEHAEVFHAGSDGFNGSDDSDGALFIGGFDGDGSVTINNTSIESSGGFGVSVWTDSQLLGCDSVTFADNEKADVHVATDGASSAC
ncbi:MAG: right-handed parallel beta-helix repeat-containing protein [Nannocystaceae bacterium]|nr:right-handed parallel beta-helix repeat-containing protein [Nannocystaceae bacterium]